MTHGDVKTARGRASRSNGGGGVERASVRYPSVFECYSSVSSWSSASTSRVLVWLVCVDLVWVWAPGWMILGVLRRVSGPYITILLATLWHMFSDVSIAIRGIFVQYLLPLLYSRFIDRGRASRYNLAAGEKPVYFFIFKLG